MSYRLSNAAPSNVLRRATDSMNRASNEVGLKWGAMNNGGQLTGHATIAQWPTDGLQAWKQLPVGAGAKSDTLYWNTDLNNTRVRGISQYSRWDLLGETGVSCFGGPAVACEANGPTCYAFILRAGQWRLSRFAGFSNTDLIAPAAFVFPCTIELQIVFVSAAQNILTILRNPTRGLAHGNAGDVIIGTFTDNSGAIQQTGVPGHYLGCPSAGDSSFWRNFDGGAL